MEYQDFNFDIVFNSCKSIFLCLLLSVSYLASLHIWNSPYSRDHPSTIKRRFISVFFMLFISPWFLYMGLAKDVTDKAPFLEILGLKKKGLWQAILMPLLLTNILFLGPIAMKIDSAFWRVNKCENGKISWFSNLTDLIWIRNHIVAPFSEEFTYRSCMLPLLLQSFSPAIAIMINPLFFGVAHFHHIWERIHHKGMNLNMALQISCFQFAYTTAFGIYSAYIFYRTGHFISVCLVHAYCNHMGFPEIFEIRTYKRNRRIVIISLFFIGFILWCLLLRPFTEPNLYYNNNL